MERAERTSENEIASKHMERDYFFYYGHHTLSVVVILISQEFYIFVEDLYQYFNEWTVLIKRPNGFTSN
jgi:hypothetical protein